MMDLIKYVLARLNEASTWTAIGMLLAMLHINVDPGMLHTASLWAAILSGAAGVLIAENGKKSGMQVAEDVMQSIVTGIKAMPANANAPTSAQGVTQ